MSSHEEIKISPAKPLHKLNLCADQSWGPDIQAGRRDDPSALQHRGQ